MGTSNTLPQEGQSSDYGPYHDEKFQSSPGNSPDKNPPASTRASGNWLCLLAGKDDYFQDIAKNKEGLGNKWHKPVHHFCSHSRR